MSRSRWTSWLGRAGALLGVAIVLWLVPPFHIIDLKAAHRQVDSATFNASTFVEKLWTERLLKSADLATDAATLLAEISRDPKLARVKHARSSGLSDTYYYFVKGEGRVVAARPDAVSLALEPGSDTVDIILETGNIFGNAIRDGTGVLDVSNFANSQDFNAISSEINHRIEQQVLPNLRAKAAVGATVRFAGCAQVSDEQSDLHPLRVIPLTAGGR